MSGGGGTFGTRTRELGIQVGEGILDIEVEFDQVYAKYQELRDDLRHPRGGQAHYCRDGLFNNADGLMEKLARGLLTESGSNLDGAAIEASEDLAREMETLAPVEFFNLKRSGHPKVTSDGGVIYDRAPAVPRLSEEQLRAQRHHGNARDYGAGTRPRL